MLGKSEKYTLKQQDETQIYFLTGVGAAAAASIFATAKICMGLNIAPFMTAGLLLSKEIFLQFIPFIFGGLAIPTIIGLFLSGYCFYQAYKNPAVRKARIALGLCSLAITAALGFATVGVVMGLPFLLPVIPIITAAVSLASLLIFSGIIINAVYKFIRGPQLPSDNFDKSTDGLDFIGDVDTGMSDEEAARLGLELLGDASPVTTVIAAQGMTKGKPPGADAPTPFTKGEIEHKR